MFSFLLLEVQESMFTYQGKLQSGYFKPWLWLWCTALYLSKFQLYACNSEKGVIKNLLLNCIQKSEWRVRFRVDPSFSSTPFVTVFSVNYKLWLPKSILWLWQEKKVRTTAFRSTTWNAIIRITWTHFMDYTVFQDSFLPYSGRGSQEVRPFRVQVPFARMDRLTEKFYLVYCSARNCGYLPMSRWSSYSFIYQTVV